MNLALDRLTRISKSKLKPILKSKIICYLQGQIMGLILLKEKVEGFLDSKLLKKLD
jgi:hypothetical protein